MLCRITNCLSLAAYVTSATKALGRFDVEVEGAAEALDPCLCQEVRKSDEFLRTYD